MKFPLKYDKNDTVIRTADGSIVLYTNGWLFMKSEEFRGLKGYSARNKKNAMKCQNDLGQCLVNLINREAKEQKLY